MRRVSVAVAAVTALFMAVGCASGARSAGTYSSVESTHKGLIATRDQINKTGESLQKLMGQSGDLRAAYKEFSGDVNKMNKLAKDVEKRTNQMREKRADYISDWSREAENIRNPEIAQLSAERNLETEAEFNRLMESMAYAKDALVPYMSDLNDIRTFLKNDLTATGLETIRPVTERVLSNGGTVNSSLDQAIVVLNGVSARLAPKM